VAVGNRGDQVAGGMVANQGVDGGGWPVRRAEISAEMYRLVRGGGSKGGGLGVSSGGGKPGGARAPAFPARVPKYEAVLRGWGWVLAARGFPRWPVGLACGRTEW